MKKGPSLLCDSPIVWNPVYTGDSPFEVVGAKNAVIDLNGHTISGVKSCGFRIFGNFTIKNGTIVGEGDSYGLLINSNNTTSGVNYNPDTRENSKVTVEDLKLVQCGIRAELSTIKVINCVYCSGTSTVTVSGVVLEGNKRMNAYQNTVSYIVTDCAGAVITTPNVVTIR